MVGRELGRERGDSGTTHLGLALRDAPCAGCPSGSVVNSCGSEQGQGTNTGCRPSHFLRRLLHWSHLVVPGRGQRIRARLRVGEGARFRHSPSLGCWWGAFVRLHLRARARAGSERKDNDGPTIGARVGGGEAGARGRTRRAGVQRTCWVPPDERRVVAHNTRATRATAPRLNWQFVLRTPTDRSSASPTARARSLLLGSLPRH